MGEHLETGGHEPRRPKDRISRWLLTGVVLSVAVLGGAAVIAHRSTNDRRGAIEARSSAASELAVQRDSTDDVKLRLAQSQAKAADFARALATPLATEQQIGQMADQLLVTAQHWQQAARTGSVSKQNAAVDEVNSYVTQLDAAAAQLGAQLDQIPAP